jgi:hypothetical protein
MHMSGTVVVQADALHLGLEVTAPPVREGLALLHR